MKYLLKAVGWGFAILVAAVAASPASAQDAAQNIHAIAVRINPGTQATFETFLERYKVAVTQSDDGRTWFVSTNAIGPVTEYTIATPLPSFQALEASADPLSPLLEVFSSDEATQLSQTLSSTVASKAGRAWIARPDLSRPPDPDLRVVGFTVILIDIKAGAQADFETYMNHQVEAANVLEDGNWTASTGAPGAPADYMVTLPIYKWSDLDDPAVRTLRQRMIDAFGEAEGAKRYAVGAAAIENITSSLIRSRPDLSRLTTAEGGNS